MDAEPLAELARLKAENEALRIENAIYRTQLEDLIRRFESAISLLRVISGSRVAELIENQMHPDAKES